jgi:hypothetical protein
VSDSLTQASVANPTAGSLLNRGEEIPWRGKRLIVGTGAHGASGNGRSPSGGETARCRGHCGAHIGSLSAAGEEGPRLRHPALHVLTGDLGDRHCKRESRPSCERLKNFA